MVMQTSKNSAFAPSQSDKQEKENRTKRSEILMTTKS
jgi:hypothetical protein